MKNIKSFLILAGRSSKFMIVAISAVGILQAVIPYVSLWFSAQILNFVLDLDINGAIMQAVYLITSVFILNILASVFMHFIWFYRIVGFDRIDYQVFRKAMKISYQEYEKAETMDDIRRSRHSSSSIGGFWNQIDTVMELIRGFCSIIFAMIFIVRLFVSIDYSQGNVLHTILLIVGFVAFYIVTSYFAYKQNKKYQEEMKTHMNEADHDMGVGVYWGQITMDVKYAKDIRLYNMQSILQQKLVQSFCGKEGRYTKFANATGRNAALLSLLNRGAEMAAFIFIAIQAVLGLILIGDIMLYYGAINRFTNDFVVVISKWSQFNVLQEYLEQFNVFLEKEEETKEDSFHACDLAQQYKVEFYNVSFRYPGSEELILDNVSMIFEMGKATAIVGKNGAGKTTLIKLLCGLYQPSAGEIKVNGLNIHHFSNKEYLKLFSVVFQDFELFSFPIDENVSSGSSVNVEKVEDALQKVSMLSRIAEMQDGISTKINHNNGEGVALSGGEAQRVAIARALYKDAPIVILDEPTAALDPIMEMKIYEDLEKMTYGKTSIFISHRMGSCKFCDHIIVLDCGHIIEEGNHEDLMEIQGVYSELYKTQAKFYMNS